jgi:transaldolase
MIDLLVLQTQDVFRPVWQTTRGDDGYVSFELDPLLEDPERKLPPEERTRRYLELGRRWSEGRVGGYCCATSGSRWTPPGS